MVSSISEPQSRTDHEILHGAAHQDFSGGGKGGDAGSDVDREAGNTVSPAFDLTGVDAGGDVESKGASVCADRGRPGDGASRDIEEGEKVVAACIDFVAAVTLELPAHQSAEFVEQLVPAMVAEPGGSLGGFRDVDERDRRQDQFRRVGGGRPLVDPFDVQRQVVRQRDLLE